MNGMNANAWREGAQCLIRELWRLKRVRAMRETGPAMADAMAYTVAETGLRDAKGRNFND